METILVRGRFHTGHRQRQHEGKCRWLHGHTWRGEIELTCERFPRDEIDMTLDFASLKAVFKHLDHKFLVTADDTALLESGLFDHEGFVVIEGRGPSVENVAAYVLAATERAIRTKYPDHGVVYRIKVTIQETDNNVFILDEDRTV